MVKQGHSALIERHQRTVDYHNMKAPSKRGNGLPSPIGSALGSGGRAAPPMMGDTLRGCALTLANK